MSADVTVHVITDENYMSLLFHTSNWGGAYFIVLRQQPDLTGPEGLRDLYHILKDRLIDTFNSRRPGLLNINTNATGDHTKSESDTWGQTEDLSCSS